MTTTFVKGTEGGKSRILLLQVGISKDGFILQLIKNHGTVHGFNT